eukprot:2638501-Pleurochrysis_carterae.AAC.1
MGANTRIERPWHAWTCHSLLPVRACGVRSRRCLGQCSRRCLGQCCCAPQGAPPCRPHRAALERARSKAPHAAVNNLLDRKQQRHRRCRRRRRQLAALVRQHGEHELVELVELQRLPLVGVVLREDLLGLLRAGGEAERAKRLAQLARVDVARAVLVELVKRAAHLVAHRRREERTPHCITVLAAVEAPRALPLERRAPSPRLNRPARRLGVQRRQRRARHHGTERVQRQRALCKLDLVNDQTQRHARGHAHAAAAAAVRAPALPRRREDNLVVVFVYWPRVFRRAPGVAVRLRLECSHVFTCANKTAKRVRVRRADARPRLARAS